MSVPSRIQPVGRAAAYLLIGQSKRLGGTVRAPPPSARSTVPEFAPPA